MTTLRSALLCGLLLLLTSTAWSDPHDRVERSLQWATFNDLLSEVRPFTNESSGSLVRHVTAAMGFLKRDMGTSSELRRNSVLAGLTPTCLACQALSKILFRFVRAVPDTGFAIKSLTAICRLLVFRQSGVCDGLINGERTVIEYVIRNSKATPDQLCQLILSLRGLPNSLYCGLQFRGDDWAVDIPPPPPIPDRGAKQLSTNELPASGALAQFRPAFVAAGQRQKNLNAGRPFLKMLHLTDLHYDSEYREGSNAECGLFLCCQAESGAPATPAAAAGKWGDYRSCDSPERLLVNMFEHIRAEHPDIDYIVHTGDSVTHDAWNLSREKNSRTINKVEALLSEYFPNTPIFGALGNHEAHPRDSFPPPEDPTVDRKFDNSWLYNLMADHWQRHLPNIQISKEARITGSYSALLEPGLRIISLNTNFCYKLNWWVLYKNTDPGNILRWLVQELLQAEKRGERVQIIAHIAPLYGDCYEQWRHQFSRIVTRFSNTIRGQFYGHSHLTHYLINYDVDNPNSPVGVQYISPSNTPFNKLNPSFTLFYVDGNHPKSTRAVLDTETFYMNLTAANTYDDTRWLPLYSAKKDFNLDSLEPKDWELFVRRMDKDQELQRKFHEYQVVASDVMKDDCDRDCRKSIVCSMVDADLFLPRKCRSN